MDTEPRTAPKTASNTEPKTAKEQTITKFQTHYCDRCGKEQEFKNIKLFSTAGFLFGCISGCLGVVTGPRLFNNQLECVGCKSRKQGTIGTK
jgi:hypothetical protein